MQRRKMHVISHALEKAAKKNANNQTVLQFNTVDRTIKNTVDRILGIELIQA
jgi:hypothetical protein